MSNSVVSTLESINEKLLKKKNQMTLLQLLTPEVISEHLHETVYSSYVKSPFNTPFCVLHFHI